MTPHEASIFTAGQNAGSRVAAGVARLAALNLLDDSHWWDRRRCRLLARALTTYADEMERQADLPDPQEAERAVSPAVAGGWVALLGTGEPRVTPPSGNPADHSGHAMAVGPWRATIRHNGACTVGALAR